MMKYILLILAISALERTSCNKNRSGIPACIKQRMDEIKAQPRWNPPAEVNEYVYEGKRCISLAVTAAISITWLTMETAILFVPLQAVLPAKEI